MPSRRIASVNQLSCYGGGGLASLPSSLTFEDYEIQSTHSAPAQQAVNRRLSFNVTQSTPGRGYARSVGGCPCASPNDFRPLAASSRAGCRPRDATFTIDRPRIHGYALDETYSIEGEPSHSIEGEASHCCAGNQPMDETFTIDRPRTHGYALDETYSIEGEPDMGESLDERIAQFDSMRYQNLQQLHQLEPQEVGTMSTPAAHSVGRVAGYAHSSPGVGYAHCTPRTPIPAGFIRPPQPCPGDSPGSSWSSGYDSSQYSTSISSSSECSAPGFHPHLGQQYPPPGSPRRGGVAFFLPMSPQAQTHQPEPPEMFPGLPRPASPEWIPFGQRRNLLSPEVSPIFGQSQVDPCSPQAGPSGLQRPVRSVEQMPCSPCGPLRRPEDFAAGDSALLAEFGIPPKPLPGMQRQFPTSRNTEAIQPIMEGILRMVDFGFETLRERAQRIEEISRQLRRVASVQQDTLQCFRGLRSMAIDNTECYLHQASLTWNMLGQYYYDTVQRADALRGPWPCLQGLEQTEVVNQDQYSELVRRAAVLARAINRELDSDATLLGQLVIAFENIEENLDRIRNFLPNFFRYVNWAMQRTEVLQRFLTYSQGDFDCFITEWREDTYRPGERQLCEEEHQALMHGLETFQVPYCPNNSASSAPTPPGSPRRGSWSPPVSPRGMTNVLPRTPPDLPVRVQRWMSELTYVERMPQEPPTNRPYFLRPLFTDYDQLEGRAFLTVQNWNNESNALNQSLNALNQSSSSSD